jgi:alkylation response protein AidB-like acyl-CoA dehydrogenase
MFADVFIKFKIMDKEILKSGEFLLKESTAESTFIIEEIDEEQQMIIQTCRDFIETEVFPNLDAIEDKKTGLTAQILSKSGELGLLGISVPEEYEGFGQAFTTSMLASDEMGAGYSFSVAYSAHTGIGTMPIVYYGNDEQKQKYLPPLALGEQKAAYCLTEPTAGSDANSGKTKAVLSEDGKHYILNGTKMWITNGGFADVFTVFAKIDNDRVLSAFIVESAWDGVEVQPEEKKMGIKGSSTTQIFFTDVKVPVENLLGKRGQGFRIALNILHMGRIKLGAAVMGAARRTISNSVAYANERKQFNQAISNFGAIQHKLAEQVIRTFANESAVYRVSKNIDHVVEKMVADTGKEKGTITIEAIGFYALEAAALKVYGSEMLDFVVDEGVQIHGGMGYSAETEIDKGYRDSRINRIFEGTNEINRIIVAEHAINKSMKGIDLKTLVEEIKNEDHSIDNSNYFKARTQMNKNFKAVALLLIERLQDKFGRKFIQEQEILSNIADIITQTYITESTKLRVEKLEALKPEMEYPVYMDILDTLMYDSANLIRTKATTAIDSFLSGEERNEYLNLIQQLTLAVPVNTKEARRRIAAKLIEDNRYNF